MSVIQQNPDDPVLAQLRRQLAGQGQPLPAEQRPASHNLRVACFHTDHLGTPLKLSDNQGQTLWQAEPDDWAAVNKEQGSSDQPIRFQGQYHDEESGLYYNRYRYYEPGLGRYVTQDPIGLMGGLNAYGYVGGNSVNFTDPSGLIVYSCDKPLHALANITTSNTGTKNGPDQGWNKLHHQFLCTVVNGKMICGGQDQNGEKASDIFGGPGNPLTMNTANNTAA